MFDIAPSEFLLFAVVALVVIGPKELPNAMRVVGRFVGKARGVAQHFRSGFDSMVREAELEEMEKKWKAENERIMREYSASAARTPMDEAVNDVSPVVEPKPPTRIDVSPPLPVMPAAATPSVPREDGI